MKWSVIVLIVIGLVSATCVAILVAVLPGQKQSAAPEEVLVSFIEAVGALESGTVVTREHILVRKVPKGHEPNNAFLDPGQAIGKVLNVSMLQGQAFTRACFPAEGGGLELAMHLADGMRAVSMEINDSFGLRGLLYPGSTVDILVSWRSSKDAEAVSKTLLEKVQVLAVDNRTVSTPEKKEGKQPKAEKYRKMMVTILVSAEQAQQLQLAVQHGTLSMTLRNPRDTATVAKSPTHLDDLMVKKKVSPPVVVPVPVPNMVEKKPGKEKVVVVAPPEPKSTWQVNVIQGKTAEDVEFEVPK
jgi:pilus assembly protein CpaB